MTDFPLQQFYSLTLDSNGEGEVIGVGPSRFNESWIVTLISVNTTSDCTFSVHRGNDTAPTSQIDATVNGNLDTSNTSITLQASETVSFKWMNGTAGSTGTVRVEGTVTMKGY